MRHLVHVDPELSPPLCHGESEDRVEADGGEGELGVLEAALVCEDGADQRQLQHGGDHVEHEGGQHKTDSSGPAVYSLGQSSCLSVQVEACGNVM